MKISKFFFPNRYFLLQILICGLFGIHHNFCEKLDKNHATTINAPLNITTYSHQCIQPKLANFSSEFLYNDELLPIQPLNYIPNLFMFGNQLTTSIQSATNISTVTMIGMSLCFYGRTITFNLEKIDHYVDYGVSIYTDMDADSASNRVREKPQFHGKIEGFQRSNFVGILDEGLLLGDFFVLPSVVTMDGMEFASFQIRKATSKFAMAVNYNGPEMIHSFIVPEIF